MDNIKAALKDVEIFITEVLAKCDLPSDINKQREELSMRLRKLLNKSDEVTVKPPVLPKRTEKPPESDDFYDDVGSIETANESEPVVQEMYEDVAATAGGVVQEIQETYDDVGNLTGDAVEGIQETYDDVGNITASETQNDNGASVNEDTQSTSSLNTKDIVQPKKISEIKNKIHEGYLDKFKPKSLFKKKRQRRYCVLTSLALYYYADQKDNKQKGTIVLPATDTVFRRGCPSYPEMKLDSKLCFELENSEGRFLFKADNQEDCDKWATSINSSMATELTQDESAFIRTQSMCVPEDNDDFDDNDELYEPVDQYNRSECSDSSASAGLVQEIYDDTEEFSIPDEPVSKDVAKDKDESIQPEAPPSLPNRNDNQAATSTPVLPPRPPSSQEVPTLPPRPGSSAPTSKPPPPPRTTPPLEHKTRPTEPSPPTVQRNAPEPEVVNKKPENVPRPANEPDLPRLKGEQFNYANVYVALYNCNADDDDDLAFERGNQLYIREKIPNSDWWVASLMDRPGIHVGLVPRNYLMAAYCL